MRDRTSLYPKLTTPFESARGTDELPFSAYPRPQMKRDSYLCLNGTWNLTVKAKKNGETVYNGEILVPFPPESRLSGVTCAVTPGDLLLYSRTFTLPEGFIRHRVLLHFGAVDQSAVVFVNGKIAGSHRGGYLPFSLDVTDLLCDGENRLAVNVLDPLDRTLPYGKQRKKRGGMWYTPISGIWQTVWLESVPAHAITSLRITPTLETVTVAVGGGESDKTITVETDGAPLSVPFRGESITLRIPSPKPWTPEEPHLYRFTVTSGEDSVASYFALRTVSSETVNGVPRLLLNGKPYFFHALLDQGYFSDGIYLPATEEGYTNDILTMKRCGFNTLRKHIKIEPECFYYDCDRLGMIVFQDMVNNGDYSFFLDTALPTVGIKRGMPSRMKKQSRIEFLRAAEETLAHLYNHPSICYYTVFNEGWGQFDSDRVYRMLKTMDETRIYDATSGWFHGKESDVQSEHVYFKPVRLRMHKERPTVLSEFGGYSCMIKEHAFCPEKPYGYRYFEEQAAFEDALVALYENEILPAVRQGLSAAVLTQVSDVEDETNGLLTYDRQVLKVSEERMQKIAEKLRRASEDSIKSK
ncbi:MAG: glycoside hydrolase family 2 [Clostridia bacterium]|nr:glycoside hydrolase family 2 [Clostridia bacterium]